MKNKRPVYLDLTQIKQPPAAIISILHRISGLIIFLVIPFLLWALHASLASSSQFDELRNYIDSGWTRLFTWIIFSALLYHLIAGIRHLLMDAHIGDGKLSGRYTAIFTFILWLVLAILTGLFLW